jgi:protein SCO1/2
LVLDELDNGMDPYLVAAAARALRAYRGAGGGLAPYVVRALTNVRYRDDPVALDAYGGDVGEDDTSPVQELLVTAEWLGSRALEILPDLNRWLAEPGLAHATRAQLVRTVSAIRGSARADDEPDGCCSVPAVLRGLATWTADTRRDAAPIAATVFEDHGGSPPTFAELFHANRRSWRSSHAATTR